MSVTEDHSTVGPSESMSLDLLCSTLLWLVLGVCKRFDLSEPESNVRKYPSGVDYHNRPTSPPKNEAAAKSRHRDSANRFEHSLQLLNATWVYDTRGEIADSSLVSFMSNPTTTIQKVLVEVMLESCTSPTLIETGCITCCTAQRRSQRTFVRRV